MTAPQQPAPTQDPAQVPVVQPVPAPEGASGPAPEDDPERAAIWPPPPEQLLEFMMGGRISIIEESGDETADADRQTVPSPGTTSPAPAQQAPVQQPPVKE